MLALNCTSAPLWLEVMLEAERGVVQSPRRHQLSLEPGIISLAEIPVRVCPTSEAVVPVIPTFGVGEVTGARKWKFGARPYGRPTELLSLLAGATLVAAVAGVSPLYLRNTGPADQGSPDPIKVRPDLKKPLVAPRATPALWRLMPL